MFVVTVMRELERTEGLKKALGTLANKKLRALRMACHKQFDKTWKTRRRRKNTKRTQAYKWLQDRMNITKTQAHIGRFDEDMCFRLLEIMRSKPLEEIKEEIDRTYIGNQ